MIRVCNSFCVSVENRRIALDSSKASRSFAGVLVDSKAALIRTFVSTTTRLTIICQKFIQLFLCKSLCLCLLTHGSYCLSQMFPSCPPQSLILLFRQQHTGR